MEEETKIINIDETFRVVIIPNNYKLQKRILVVDKKTKKKEFKYITEGYYPELVHLCHSYINNAPMYSETTIRSVTGLVKSIKDAENKIIKAIKEKEFMTLHQGNNMSFSG
jgi:hypothetical protein